MGANDAGCPAGTGNGCAWARHGSFVYSPSLGVISRWMSCQTSPRSGPESTIHLNLLQAPPLGIPLAS
eukprot:2878801-Pyramimonas_sp.AAC.1